MGEIIKKYRSFTTQEWFDFKYSGWECLALFVLSITISYLILYFLG